MRGYVVKIVVIHSFIDVISLWSGTFVFFLCLVLAIIRCSIEGKKISFLIPAMRRNGEIYTNCGPGRYKRKEYSSMKVLPSLRLSACLTALDGQMSLCVETFSLNTLFMSCLRVYLCSHSNNQNNCNNCNNQNNYKNT